MKILFLILTAFSLLSFTFYSVTIAPRLSTEEARREVLALKNRSSFGCSPDLASLNLGDSSNVIPLLQGWGNYRMPVTVANDSARTYFAQGINMYYGFHIIEALASFEKAVQFDPGFAMGYWGKALAYGPNINDFGYAASPDALTAMKKSKELSGPCTAPEKGLIEAMQVRYSEDTIQTRAHLNQLYADKMKALRKQFPKDEDIATLYADALMLQHPWDFYDKEGKAKPWTPEIVNTIEAVLKTDPHHPGAGHYYIHAIEASNHPERGMAVARKLPSLMPGVAHLVHMPSHIFVRSGYYKEGVEVNEKSVKGYYNYLSSYSPVANNTPLYLIHNLHMQAACANTDGRYEEAMKVSVDCKNSYDSSWVNMPDYFGVFVQYLDMTPLLTDIRFGKWDNILASKPVPDSLVYANLLMHYGRGLAFARKHQFASANTELKALQEKMNEPQLAAEAPVFANEGISGARVAEKVLQGVIAEEQEVLDQAITYFREAVVREDSMKYNEPRDWVHPTRQYLGRALLKAKQYSAAEKVYKEDLKTNPHNGWSLTGLTSALERQRKTKEAVSVKQAAAKAFARSDLRITESAF